MGGFRVECAAGGGALWEEGTDMRAGRVCGYCEMSGFPLPGSSIIMFLPWGSLLWAETSENCEAKIFSPPVTCGCQVFSLSDGKVTNRRPQGIISKYLLKTCTG